MKLSDIYKKVNYKHKAHNFYNNKDYMIMDAPPWDWNFKYLRKPEIPPTPAQIASAQREAAITFIKSQGLIKQKLLLRLKRDIQRLDQSKMLTNYFSIEELIQKTLGTVTDEDFYSIAWLKEKRFKNLDQLKATLIKNQVELRNTLNELKNIYSFFQTKSNNGIVPFPKKVQTQLSNLENVIKTLESDLNTVATNPEQPLGGEIKARIGTGGGNQGYLAYTQNIGNELKGFLLPLETILFFNQSAQQVGKMIDLGAITNKQGQEAPVDIAYYLGEGPRVNATIGGEEFKNWPLEKLRKEMEKMAQQHITKTISIEDFPNLLESNIGFIQSKATANPPPIGHFSKTVQDIAETDPFSRMGGALMRLISLKRTHNARIYASHKHYDALFSYELSKHMDSIIGKEANLILTDKGLMTLDQWVKQEFITHYYQPRRSISINSIDKEVPIYLK